MRSEKFTVDAALLRELGSRLVGKPHIALAELIKNSYDADARHVRVTFDGGSIVVEDDGHGMNHERFVAYWMRVGTTHKAAEKYSPELKRSLTGSKGVGRLAVQLLARGLTIESVGLLDPELRGYEYRLEADESLTAPSLRAEVDWDRAVQDGDLTSVEVPIVEHSATGTFANGSRVGTRLTLKGLRDEWGEDDFRGLAREIWALQPPFEVSPNDEASFNIELVSQFGPVVKEFRDQMQAIFRNWQGRITLELLEDDPGADVLFEFNAVRDYDDEAERTGLSEPSRSSYPSKLVKIEIEAHRPGHFHKTQLVRVLSCPIEQAQAEIRVFNLQFRQAGGLTVDDARKWVANFGGVHIYDDGFRLPYYGPEDWLHIERDHARRLSRSQLVPTELRVSKALQDLPSRRRIFGTVNISTATERRTAHARGLTEMQALSIQVSRDRLADNIAFRALENVVRLSLDLYSTEMARSKATASAKRKKPSPPPKPSKYLSAVRDTISAISSSLPRAERESLDDYLTDAERGMAHLERARQTEAALLGSLATVGMTTLAWEHESTKQRLVVLSSAKTLSAAAERGAAVPANLVRTQANALRDSAHRLSDISGMFRSVLDREARESISAPKAQRFVERTASQLRVLARGASVFVQLPAELKLPPGTFAGWTAIFQNIFINAFNAVLESRERRIDVDFVVDGSTSRIRVQDTGVGVDLANAERFFLPFERGMTDDPRRAELGLGGAGLGLTIVRMIADTMNITVRFVEPDMQHSTAVAIEWESDE